MSKLVRLPIENIRHRPDARQRSDEALMALAESITEVGLINPIRVRLLPMGQGYEVVAGSHRLQAFELNGETEIDCIVSDADDLHAELAMIDENLCRAELSPADRAKQTFRRKEIYEALHPETRNGVNQHSSLRQVGEPSAERFTVDTATVSGKSERAVQRDAERGEKVIDAAIEVIRGTVLDTGTYLDRLKRLLPEEQIATAKRDLAYQQLKEKEKASPRPMERQEGGGIAARYQPATAANTNSVPEKKIAFDEIRAAIELLYRLKSDDFMSLCPPASRAGMRQRLARLAETFQRVTESSAA